MLPGRWSPRLHQIVALLGTLVPFGQVPALVALIRGVSISPATVRRVTEAAGAALATGQEADAERVRTDLPPSPPGPLRQQVSVDGAMVPIVGGEWREVKTLAIGELDAGAAGHAGQWSYVARILEADGFADLATGELHRRGTFAAETVVAVADGAVWCQQFYAYHLPGAIRILDFPHAAGHLSRAAQACWGPGDDRRRLESRPNVPSCWPGKATEVVQAVTELPVTQAPNPSEAYTVMRQVAHYLQERLPQLAYADFVAAGYPIGSGAVESANKRVVEARLKGGGMHWTVANANAVLALRGVLCSQRWETAWDADRAPAPAASPPAIDRGRRRPPAPARRPNGHRCGAGSPRPPPPIRTSPTANRMPPIPINATTPANTAPPTAPPVAQFPKSESHPPDRKLMGRFVRGKLLTGWRALVRPASIDERDIPLFRLSLSETRISRRPIL